MYDKMYNFKLMKKNILYMYILCIIILNILGVILNIECKINERRLVDVRTAIYSPIPLPVTGECKAGKEYKIESIEDLESQIDELECIFAAGKPTYNGNIPQGFSYGYLLSAANTGFWNRIADLGYQGDFVVSTRCNGKLYNIGWMSIAGIKIGTATWTSGYLPNTAELADGEYPLGENKGIIMDFTKDFNKICTPEGNENSLTMDGFSPFVNSMYPVRSYIDMGRVVGIDRSDGAVITLNKAFSTNGNIYRTVLIYATKTFDRSIIEPNTNSINLIVPEGPNGEKKIPFRRAGAEIALSELNPFSSPEIDQLQTFSINSFVSAVRSFFPFL